MRRLAPFLLTAAVLAPVAVTFTAPEPAAMDTPVTTSLGANLDYLLKAIRPSVAAVAAEPETNRLRAAILMNVEASINDIVTAARC